MSGHRSDAPRLTAASGTNRRSVASQPDPLCHTSAWPVNQESTHRNRTGGGGNPLPATFSTRELGQADCGCPGRPRLSRQILNFHGNFCRLQFLHKAAKLGCDHTPGIHQQNHGLRGPCEQMRG